MAPLTALHHPDCYPSDQAKALSFFRDAISICPAEKLSPVPENARLAGIITPHIDFRVSLPSYAAAFRPLWEQPLAETYLILGVGHRSRLEWNLDRRDYETPLGRAICAGDLVDALADGTDPKRLFSPAAHEGEHSIEFPLLWLQALHHLHADKRKTPVRFVPILCGGLHDYVDGRLEWDELSGFHRLGEKLAALFEKYPPGDKLRIIVSIDGCHMGPRFQHPFRVTPDMLKETSEWERMLWACAAQGNVRKFLEWFRAERNDRYFDGVGALALLMSAGKFKIERTYYEQWFTKTDASVVTFSSGRVLS